MNYVLVGLTFLILAWMLVSCAVLGADRLAGAEHVSRDGIEAPDRARAPYERSGPRRGVRDRTEDDLVSDPGIRGHGLHEHRTRGGRPSDEESHARD